MLIEDLSEEPLKGFTLIYGPSSSGKSTACLELLRGRSVYVSTNRNFSLERLKKMRKDADELISRLVLFEPKDFLEFERAVESAVKLSAMADLLVVDSIAFFLRSANRKLANQQLRRTITLLKHAQCPVLVTSEVYDYLSEGGVTFIGGDMLRLAADTIIELNEGVLTIRKHHTHTGRERDYAIADSGLVKV